LVADTRPLPRKPDWLKVRFPAGERYQQLKSLMREQGLHTICEDAKCPNIGECWNAGTATFMILGDVCTRSCGFCNVATGRPGIIDAMEPYRLAQAVRTLGLEYVVITSVNRDDVESGGAEIFAACIRAIRHNDPAVRVEVLIPDFKGNWDALACVAEARPFVLNHNIETAPRLYRQVRPQAVYVRSLELIRRAKAPATSISTSPMSKVSPVSAWIDVTDASASPHGTMCSKYDRSVFTFSAKPCVVTPRETRTPIAAIFASLTQTPALRSERPAAMPKRPSTSISIASSART
jgi:lipoic acid synthetase